MGMNHTKANILGTSISVVTHEDAIEATLALAERHSSSYVCFATAHMLVEAGQNCLLRSTYDRADMITPDGRPVGWGLRLTGHRNAQCVSGPNLVPKLLQAAATRGVPVGFYGGRPTTLRLMIEALRKQYPTLNIVYSFSPPFRPLTGDETEQVCTDIRESGAGLVFVGLGSPKQELWMGSVSRRLPCVLLGVGAVFEFLSGEKTLPPESIQKLGLTWLVRLCQEPRRLFYRNIAYSPRFVCQFVQQHIFGKWRSKASKRIEHVY
jgi:N-acetylglucosaminyldiphosphoundecaprenol N-acetyl-beta-D-mannosaminyltransferase